MKYNVFLFFLFLFVHISCFAVVDKENEFGLPIDFPVLFSGNFAELRSNHFHGGLDFKTQGVIGKPVHAPADGYVSRVTVSSGGYGNAMYVTHFNGYTTVYGHLESFMPEIEKRIRQYQYENETFAVDISFHKDEFPIKKGDIISLSGNTGYSFGPHLHFEIRETESNDLVNPLIFYKSHVKDTHSPKAYAFSLYSRFGRGVIERNRNKFISPVYMNSIKDTVKVWGEIGFGVRALDFMDDTSNNYGIYGIELEVDDSLLFSCSMDRVVFSENRLINAWIDYETYYNRGKRFMRLHLLDNNPLSSLSTDDNRGWLLVDEERMYNVRCLLSDMHGNVSKYEFVIKGERCEIPVKKSANTQCLYWDFDNELRDLGMRLRIPNGELFEDAILDVDRIEKPNSVSDRYNLNGEIYPLWHGGELDIRMNVVPECGVEKCYIRRITKSGGYGVGGFYKDGWMTTLISVLGCYEIAVDTFPPLVKPINEKEWSRNALLSFSMIDKETGIETYKGYIDNEFKLFKYSSKNARLTCNFKTENVQRGTHTLYLIVTDKVGNETIIEKQFTY